MSDELGDPPEAPPATEPEPGAEPGHDMLVYELGEWTPDERARLGLLLEGEGIPHQWDGDELLVPEVDEGRVDAVLDQIEFPDSLDAAEDDDGDDEANYMVISDLFVAMDRLANATSAEVELAAEVIHAVDAVLAIPRPFGIEDADWIAVRKRASAIAAALQSEVDDDEIIADANMLRDLLRRFV